MPLAHCPRLLGALDKGGRFIGVALFHLLMVTFPQQHRRGDAHLLLQRGQRISCMVQSRHMVLTGLRLAIVARGYVGGYVGPALAPVHRHHRPERVELARPLRYTLYRDGALPVQVVGAAAFGIASYSSDGSAGKSSCRQRWVQPRKPSMVKFAENRPTTTFSIDLLRPGVPLTQQYPSESKAACVRQRTAELQMTPRTPCTADISRRKGCLFRLCERKRA